DVDFGKTDAGNRVGRRYEDRTAQPTLVVIETIDLEVVVLCPQPECVEPGVAPGCIDGIPFEISAFLPARHLSGIPDGVQISTTVWGVGRWLPVFKGNPHGRQLDRKVRRLIDLKDRGHASRSSACDGPRQNRVGTRGNLGELESPGCIGGRPPMETVR